jgi:hypothetical protein
MSVKIYPKEFGKKNYLWVDKSSDFTQEEINYLHSANLRASKNPKKWFGTYNPDTEQALKNFFLKGETEYVPDDDDNPLVDDNPKPGNISGYAQTTPTVHKDTGEHPATYVSPDDFTIRSAALHDAAHAVHGLTRETPPEEIVKIAKRFEKYLRGE